MTAADHTPSPATDGLREAVEALAAELHDDNVEHRLRAVLAAHPAPPSETATEGDTRVEWGVRADLFQGVREVSSLSGAHRVAEIWDGVVMRRTSIVGAWHQVEETQP